MISESQSKNVKTRKRRRRRRISREILAINQKNTKREAAENIKEKDSERERETARGVSERERASCTVAAANAFTTATITNSALAMSQLGTVYATKRRRRNGKR